MHTALLDFARDLGAGSPGPKQVHWRRAISSAYYAVFHLLVHEGTEQLRGSGLMDAVVRTMLSRSFDHGPMKTASEHFTKQIQPNSPLARLTIQAELVTVARTFVRLQGMRHLADYDVGIAFDHLTTQEAIRLAREAHTAWDAIRGSEAARVYLFLMLSKEGLVRHQQTATWLLTGSPPAGPGPSAPPASAPPTP